MASVRASVGIVGAVLVGVGLLTTPAHGDHGKTASGRTGAPPTSAATARQSGSR